MRVEGNEFMGEDRTKQPNLKGRRCQGNNKRQKKTGDFKQVLIELPASSREKFLMIET